MDREAIDILVHRVYFFFESSVILYVFVINAIYLALTLMAFFSMLLHNGVYTQGEQDALLQSSLMPSISLVVPAYNEAMTVRESVGGMLRLNYPNYEMIVVNDGSKDDTLKILIEEFKLYRS